MKSADTMTTLPSMPEPTGHLDGKDKLADFMSIELRGEHARTGSYTPREFNVPVYDDDKMTKYGALCREAALEEAANLCQHRAESVYPKGGYPEGLKNGAQGCADAIRKLK